MKLLIFTMLSQQRFASPHSQKHIVPTLVALRPDPAAESCVDPQTVDNCVECSSVSYLVPSIEGYMSLGKVEVYFLILLNNFYGLYKTLRPLL